MEALQYSYCQLLYIIRRESRSAQEATKMWRTCGPSCDAQDPIHSPAVGRAGRLVGRRSARAKTAGPGRQSPAPGFVPVDTPETPYD